MHQRIDKLFLGVTLFLMCGGFFIFMSASLGLLARQGAEFGAVAFNQAFFGFFLGGLSLWFFSRIPYRIWKKYAPHIFVLSLITTFLVFVPFLGFEHGGARRWIALGPFTFQPAEFLKLGVILFLAGWYAHVKDRVRTVKWGVVPLLVVIALSGAALLIQPDTGTFLVVGATACAMFIVAGGKWRHLGALALLGIVAAGVLIMSKPYIKERVLTFIDPARDAYGAGWQIQQSLIAVGSGGFWGRGFGQSIQKFSFLPEPIGDSIFAVAAEEFGFVGSISIVAVFVLFLLRGLHIARRAPDHFGGLLVSGIVIMIVAQAFLNIGAMLGVVPLTGLPLSFVSKGGSALLFTLIGIGMILNVSKYKKKI